MKFSVKEEIAEKIAALKVLPCPTYKPAKAIMSEESFPRYNLGFSYFGPLEQCNSGRLMNYTDHVEAVHNNDSLHFEYLIKKSRLAEDIIFKKSITINKLKLIAIGLAFLVIVDIILKTTQP
jgi:hypothetical protein